VEFPIDSGAAVFMGLTNGGRLLSLARTVRKGKIRAVSAFPAGVADTKDFLERSR
jgi:hypothetical protein